MSSADKQEEALYIVARTVHGTGAAISYDKMPPGERNAWRAIVWDARGEAMSAHFAKTRDAVRKVVAKAFAAILTARDKARAAERHEVRS